MTKLEFMTQLERALKKHGAADCEDIMEEYEQHFAFKLADGYSEEEIAAKLGAPEDLAQQFAPSRKRALRTALLISFTLFGVFLVLGAAVSAILAGQVEFWHVWGWFGYGL